MTTTSTPKSLKTEDPQLVSYGLGRSKANGGQNSLAIVRRSTSLYTLAVEIKRHSEMGPKSDCPCLYVGIPKVERENESALKTNCAGVDLLAGDLDGCIRSQEDLDKVLRFVEGYEYILHTSGSHNPIGGHPDPKKAGQHRYRLILRWSRRLTYEEHKGATIEFLVQLAQVLGLEVPELGRPQLSTWLLNHGVDPCCSRAMQPAYFPRWPEEEGISEVARQAFVRHEGGGGLDPDVLLTAAQERVQRTSKRRKLAPPRIRELAKLRSSPSSTPSTLDPMEGARLDALEWPESPGQNDHHMWKVAANARRGWALEEDQILDLLGETFPSQTEERRAHKARSAAALSPGVWRLDQARRSVALGSGHFDDLEVVGGSLATSHTQANSGQVARPPHYRKRKRRSGHSSRYLPPYSYDQIRAKRVTYIRAPQGAGKTTALRALVRHIRALGGRVIYLCHRQALTRSAARDLGIPCYLDSPKGESFTGSVSICLDSVDRVDLWGDSADEQLVSMRPIALCIVDESEQVIRHTFGKTILGKRRLAAVWSSLRALLQSSENIIFQDADLGRLTTKASRLILGSGSEQKLNHNFREPRHVVSYLNQGKHTEDLLKAVTARTGGGERVYYGSTSRSRIDQIAKRIEGLDLGLKVLVVTQRTTGLAEVRAFLEDPSLAENYDVILASPTLGTGVSIDCCPFVVYFDALTDAGSIATDVVQALSRCRQPVDDTWRIHIRGNHKWAETDPTKIRTNMLGTSKETRDALSRITTWSPGYTAEGTRCLSPDNSDLVSLCAEVRSVEALGTDLHTVLPLLFVEYGYSIEVNEEEADDKKKQETAHKEAKEALHTEDVDRVLSAPALTEEEAQDLETRAQTPEHEAALRRYRICDLYGVSEVTREHVEIFDQGRHRRLIHRFVDVQNWQAGHRHAVLIKDHNALARTGGATSPEVKGYALQADLESKLWGLFGITDITEDAAKGTPLKTIGKLDKPSLERVKAILGINLDKLTSNQIAAALARRCGIKLKSERIQVDGKRTRVYRLDRESVERMQELAQKQLDRSRRNKRDEGGGGCFADPTWNPNSPEILLSLVS